MGTLEAGDWQRGWAPWKLVIGRDSGEASRADPGTREAIAGLEARGAMADQGAWMALAIEP